LTAAVVLFRLPRVGADMDIPVVGFVLENSLLWASLAVVLALAAPGVSRTEPDTVDADDPKSSLPT
ncbi:glycosyl transferase, partial [Rhodococcus erythropolis]|nr:glycosyl transferase [Rhodococcus erythropolis]